jgi:hypothetical protein
MLEEDDMAEKQRIPTSAESRANMSDAERELQKDRDIYVSKLMKKRKREINSAFAIMDRAMANGVPALFGGGTQTDQVRGLFYTAQGIFLGLGVPAREAVILAAKLAVTKNDHDHGQLASAEAQGTA